MFLFCYLSGRVETGLCHRIRQLGFKRLQELSFSYYDNTRIGYLIARLTTDTQRLGDTIGWGLVDLMWAIAYLLITRRRHGAPQLEAVAVRAGVIPLIAVLSVYFQKRILDSYREVRKLNSRITGAFNEGITGAKTTKTLVREQANDEEFTHLTATMRNASVRAAVLSALFMPLVISLAALARA